MLTVVGIFVDRDAAFRAAEAIRLSGARVEDVSVLTPGNLDTQQQRMPTSDTEAPGTGAAVGGVIGAAAGASGGMAIGAAASSILVPGIGPVFAVGTLAAALLGIGGAVAGAAAGAAAEEQLSDGLPKDEVYVYRSAVRSGRSVVVAFVDDDDIADRVRHLLEEAGAESLDAARHSTWIGLKDAREETYHGPE